MIVELEASKGLSTLNQLKSQSWQLINSFFQVNTVVFIQQKCTGWHSAI